MSCRAWSYSAGLTVESVLSLLSEILVGYSAETKDRTAGPQRENRGVLASARPAKSPRLDGFDDLRRDVARQGKARGFASEIHGPLDS